MVQPRNLMTQKFKNTDSHVIYHGSSLVYSAGDGSAIQDFLGQLTGERTVPRVFIDGKCVGGGSDVKRLHSEGKLVPLLTKAKAL